eukprot:32640_1
MFNRRRTRKNVKNESFNIINEQKPLNLNGTNKTDNKQIDTSTPSLQNLPASYNNQLAQQDISRALAVILNFDLHDDVIIGRAIGLLGNCNVASINENTECIRCLIDLINYKCKKQDFKLSSEKITIITKSIRLIHHLLVHLCGRGKIETNTNIIHKYPEYGVLMSKYIHLLSELPLTTNPDMLKQLLNGVLLEQADVNMG